MKKIAILGAGLAGLGVASALRGRADAVVFDKEGLGAGASGAATGLMHPFPGRLALPSWRASEGMEATRNYLNQIQGSAHLGGVLRVAVNEQQRRDWPLAAGPLAQWRESGLFIPSGVTVYMRRYLEGLLALSGAELRKGELEGEFDAVIFATGIGMIEKGFPIQPVRGRAVFAEWKGDLPFALVSNGHVTPTEWEGVIGIGSTYHEESLDSLFNRVSLFFPEVREAKIVEVKEAFRAAQMGQYRPIVKRLGPKEWGFGALGSRGLLYHALLGKELADEVLSSIR